MNKTRTPNPLSLGKRMKPTMKHRPAVWESMLGTVNAMNEAGEVRYFDYAWEDALEFAGFSPDRDPRTFKADRAVQFANWHHIRRGQRVLYIRKAS
jgi:hypothetical protein